MAPTKSTVFHNGPDDDVVTWEHLEDISTIPTENTQMKYDGELDNEAQSYHIENVNVESQRPTHGAPSGRPHSRSVVRVDSWFEKKSES